MAHLQVRCSVCKVATTCPANGSSPLLLRSSRLPLFCQIVGGYATSPVPRDALSEASKAISDKDGPCLTLVEVPRFDADSGKAYFEKVKVFHHPIQGPRSTTRQPTTDSLFPSSYKREKPKR